jgi:hypothetical protein
MAGRKFARPARNPHGIGGFKPGQSGNPGGVGGFKPGESGNPSGSAYGPKNVDLMKLAKVHTRAALATELSIMRDRSVSAATRLAAAENVLNRGHGRPIQPHSNPDLTPLDWSKMGTEELMTAIARLEAALGQKPTIGDYIPGSVPLGESRNWS